MAILPLDLVICIITTGGFSGYNRTSVVNPISFFIQMNVLGITENKQKWKLHQKGGCVCETSHMSGGV